MPTTISWRRYRSPIRRPARHCGTQCPERGGDLPQARLATAGVVAWCQTKPRRKVPATLELVARPDRGGHGRGGHRSYSVCTKLDGLRKIRTRGLHGAGVTAAGQGGEVGIRDDQIAQRQPGHSLVKGDCPRVGLPRKTGRCLKRRCRCPFPALGGRSRATARSPESLRSDPLVRRADMPREGRYSLVSLRPIPASVPTPQAPIHDEATGAAPASREALSGDLDRT